MTFDSLDNRDISDLDVVLVEDSRAAQSLIRPMLTAMRVRRVRSYDRPDLALKSMITDPAAVVLADWDMRPNAAELFVRLLRQRSFEPVCFVPVIALTSEPTLRLIDRAMSCGATQILAKPLSPAALRDRLRQVVLADPGYELAGEHFIVAGMSDLLETRVRNDKIAEMIRKAETIEAIWRGEDSRTQVMIDEILSDDRKHQDRKRKPQADEPDRHVLPEPTAPPPRRWHGWRV
ncbi:MAG: response regulator [Pseudomonadota bacterium]